MSTDEDFMRNVFVQRGYSAAEAEWMAYRSFHGAPPRKSARRRDLLEAARKYRERIESIEVNETRESASVVVYRKCGGTIEPFEVTLTGGDAQDRARFYAAQLYEIEKLGDPRWDALVQEMLAPLDQDEGSKGKS